MFVPLLNWLWFTFVTVLMFGQQCVINLCVTVSSGGPGLIMCNRYNVEQSVQSWSVNPSQVNRG